MNPGLSVQQKIPCVFKVSVIARPTSKRNNQPFQVLATEELNPDAVESGVATALVSEKVDGTCCYVAEHRGVPSLWARLDRKPTKAAAKRFSAHRASNPDTAFRWNLERDLRAVPESWVPALGAMDADGSPTPDHSGHLLGWVPVEGGGSQYRWHRAAMCRACRRALVLTESGDHEEEEEVEDEERQRVLVVKAVPLSELAGQSLELIGTHVNANPYGLGSSQHPVHLLVPHGALGVRRAPPAEAGAVARWLGPGADARGRVEGLVWATRDGHMFKIHRHHLGLPWPPASPPLLATRPVRVRVEECRAAGVTGVTGVTGVESGCGFSAIARLDGATLPGLRLLLRAEIPAEEAV